MKNSIRESKLDVLTQKHIYAFGCGHFLNDLTGATGFNFLLIYLKAINPIDEINPGYYAG